MSDRMKSSLPDDTGLEPQNDLFRPFPRDVFPTSLARFVEAQAASLNCDEANVALPVLSTLASAIGATRRIRIKRNWIEPAVLWTAVVSNRGVRTGQPVQAAIEPLAVRQDEAFAALPRKMGAYIPLRNDYRLRVHCWYEARFGRALAPYASAPDAIATYPTTATCLGVRPGAEGLEVCAPFGLADLMSGIVRPNKVLVTVAVYTAKAARWQAAWPRLRVMPWA